MPPILSFRNGIWISYEVPVPRDVFWSDSHVLKASAFYSSLVTNFKFTTFDRPEILTEMYINSIVYPGLSYGKEFNKKIKYILKIMNEETT